MNSTKSGNIHARVNPALKLKASKALDDIGISLTQFIEISLNQIANDKDVKLELRLLKNDKEDEYTELKNVDQFRKLISSK